VVAIRAGSEIETQISPYARALFVDWIAGCVAGVKDIMYSILGYITSDRASRALAVLEGLSIEGIWENKNTYNVNFKLHIRSLV
jgi:hypothetical protein